MTLENTIALVTGGSRGIGRAICVRLASMGATVGINYVANPAAAEETLQQVEAAGGRGFVVRFDVADAKAVQESIKEIIASRGAIDILVNNAGITRDSLMLRMKEEDWDAVLDTNLKSAFNTVKALQRVLMKSPAGRIINMSSVIGLVGNIGQANYAASKAGLIGFTKSLAQEFAPRKVTCNAIAPGFISTEMSNAIPDNLKEEIVKKIPLKEQGSVEDIAALTAFLASDDARYITGQVIACDGGMTM